MIMIEAAYSSTGWLIYARYADTSSIRETKLLETSDEKLLNDV